MPILRHIERRDLSDLVQLCREHARFEKADWTEYDRSARLEELLLDQDDARCWVVDDNRTLGGFASVFVERSTWDAKRFLHLDCIYLRPEYRRRGFGQKLLVEALRFASAIGIDSLQWQTPSWNSDAAKFYDSLGAKSTEKLRYTLDQGPFSALLNAAHQPEIPRDG